MNRRKVIGLALLSTLLLIPGGRLLLRKGKGEQKVIKRIAFGSCADQSRAQPIWDVIAKAKPDLFLFIGDNVYADTDDMSVMSARYAELGAKPEFAAFRSKVPVLATWDDHDYGINDGGVEYGKKEESKKIMLDFFGEPVDSERRQRPGIYTSYEFGPDGKRLQIILLDLRWFRSPLHWDDRGDEQAGGYVPNTDPNATILGAEQWLWLERELQKPADLRLIASSTQFTSGEHHWEKWANFPAEKERMLRLLDRLRVKNAFVISGDMHFGELSVEKTPDGFTLYDLTSSGLNYFEPGTQYPNSKRMAILDDFNFGFIEIDWKRLKVSLQVRDGVGATRIKHDVVYR